MGRVKDMKMLLLMTCVVLSACNDSQEMVSRSIACPEQAEVFCTETEYPNEDCLRWYTGYWCNADSEDDLPLEVHEVCLQELSKLDHADLPPYECDYWR